MRRSENKNFSLSSFRNAFNGAKYVAVHEPNFRIQLGFAMAAVSLFAYTHASLVWWSFLAIVCSLVLSAELLNSALEKMMDQIHPEFHANIGIAKDCAAGAVLVLSCMSVIVFILYCLQL